MIISDDEDAIAELLRSTKRVAVLGIKTEDHARAPAFYVPKHLDDAGVEVIPVPVYFPEVTEILGHKVFRRVADVPGPIDIVDVFRRPQDVAAHVPDLLASKPRAVWLQLGITDDASAEILSRAGILVVQDRCLMVEWDRHVQR